MPDEIVQEVPAAVEPVTTEVAAAPVGELVADIAPVENTVAAPPVEVTAATVATPEPTLLDRIEALPADALHLLHDALAHIHHGLTEVSLMTGMTRLGEILGHVKSKL